MDALDIQVVEKTDDVSDLQSILVRMERLSALSMTPAVHGDDAIAGRLERLQRQETIDRKKNPVTLFCLPPLSVLE